MSGVSSSPEFVLELGLALRERVLPSLGSVAGRASLGEGAGGDVTFAVDEIAESFLAEFVASRAPRMAFYSEDPGLVAPADAVDVLIVDPIDGTRPAMAGLESACVAVALAPLGGGSPVMGDVVAGCVVEIKSGDWFLAVRGGGVSSSRAGLRLSSCVDVGRMFWGFGGAVALLGRSGRRRFRWLGRASRWSAAARVRARVPDVLDLRFELRAPCSIGPRGGRRGIAAGGGAVVTAVARLVVTAVARRWSLSSRRRFFR